MCGEKVGSSPFHRESTGSPPRVRGKVAETGMPSAVTGITPACAGKSQSSALYVPPFKDHPRVCGEKYISLVMIRQIEGSPPRVRGKEFLPPGERAVLGITPACAGKRTNFLHCFGCFGDHPRVCGEKKPNITKPVQPQGSPPRVRGKENNSPAAGVRGRITPACAGKSQALLTTE